MSAQSTDPAVAPTATDGAAGVTTPSPAPLGADTAGNLPDVESDAPSQGLLFDNDSTREIDDWCKEFDYESFEAVFPSAPDFWIVQGLSNPEESWVTCIFSRGMPNYDASGKSTNKAGAVRIDLYVGGVDLTGSNGGIAIMRSGETCVSSSIATQVEDSRVAVGACRADDLGIGVLAQQSGNLERPEAALASSVELVKEVNARLGPFPWGGDAG